MRTPPQVYNSIVETKQCCYKFLSAIPKSSGQVRVEYHSKDQIGRNKWILNYIRNSKVFRHDNISCGIRWHIDGYDICYRCWKLATGISTCKMQYYQRVLHGNSGVN
jgi:hypothetical protein